MALIRAYAKALLRYRVHSCSAAALLCLTTLSAQATATTPGAIAGHFAVDGTGAATYSIPFRLPPGIAGLTPHLGLVYNSHSSNGLAGYGWTLSGLSTITRCANTLADNGKTEGVTFTADDRFCLDGMQLRLDSGTYGDDGATYRTEINNFSRITSYRSGGEGQIPTSGPQWFSVETPEGLTYEYGKTQDSEIVLAGGAAVRIWALDKISDLNGNTITFQYTDNADGGYQPSEVDYTGHGTGTGAITPTHAVIFGYEDLPSGVDAPAQFLAGLTTHLSQRLKTVSVQYNGSVTTQYTLNYETSSPTHRSRLTSITECAGGLCYAPTAINWQNGTAGWNSPENSNISSVAGTDPQAYQYAHLMDVNGDGRMDLVYPQPGSDQNQWMILLGTASGFSSSPITAATLPASDSYKYAQALDVNGDGLADLILPGVDGHVMILQSTGTSFSVSQPAGLCWYGDCDPSAADYGGEVSASDINGDGLGDLVWADATGGLHARLNTGGGVFASAISLSSPDYSAGMKTFYFNPDQYGGSSFSGQALDDQADFNGDGRTDRMARETVEVDQTCTADSPPGCQPQTLTYIYWDALAVSGAGPDGYGIGRRLGHETNVQGNDSLPPIMGDFDGDGRTDFVWAEASAPYNSDFTYRTILSGQTGENDSGISIAGDYGSELVADYDGDGKADILAGTGAPTDYHVLRSDGATLANVATTSIPIPISYGNASGGADNSYRVGDINGDGLDDIVWSQGGTWHYALHSGIHPDLVAKITDGLGNYVSLTYKPLTDTADAGFYTKGSTATYPDEDTRAPLYVVSQSEANDGTGSSYKEDYTYTGAQVNLEGRGFLGFAKVTSKDSRDNVTTETDYSQTFPFIGPPTDVITIDSAGKQVRDVSTKYDDTVTGTGSNAIHFPHVRDQTTIEDQVTGQTSTGTAIRTIFTNFRDQADDSDYYDNYGRPTRITITTTDMTGDNVTPSVFTVVKQIAYADNATSWCYALPTDLKVTRGDTNAITRETAFTNDTAHCQVLTQKIGAATGASLPLTSTYEHDAFGNVDKITLTGLNVDRVTELSYGGAGDFPEQVTNALDQTATATWDPGLGVRTSVTTISGQTVSRTYDGFGRPLTETRADNSRTTWTYNFCDSSCPDGGAYTISTDIADAAGDAGEHQVTVYDSYGRPIQTQQLELGGKTAFVDTVYDAFGRKAKQSAPYFAGDTVYWTTYSYDLLGRPTETTAPANDQDTSNSADTCYVYSGLGVTTTNPNGQQKLTQYDALGEIVAVTDNYVDTNSNIPCSVAPNNLAPATTKYTYTPFGELETVTDAAGNKTTLTYDGGKDDRGFKTAISDPDMGNWSYQYDAAGDLTQQTDANGKIIYQSFDALGRLVSRTEPAKSDSPQPANGDPAATTTWTYDDSTTAIASAGQLLSISTPGGYAESRTYDSLGRPQDVTRTINGTAYTVSKTYDGFSRLKTLTYPESAAVTADQPPVADAGADQTVLLGTAVTLSGSGSDPDGTPVNYTWRQSAGPGKGTLSSATTAQTTFQAAYAGTYVFTLLVNDGLENASDSTTVTVQPHAPASISVPATSYNGNFTLSWGAADGADCYQIQESTSATFTDPAVACTTTTTTTSNDYTGYADGSYYYRVRAIGGNVPGPWSATAIVNVKHPPSVPAAPTFDLNPTADNAFQVQWVKPSGLVAEYRLEEAANGGAWTEVYGGLNLSWPTSGRGAGSYAYRLRACSDTASTASCSGYSATATETVLGPPSTPAAPYFNTGLSTDGAYNVFWRQPAGAVNQVRYHLQEAVSGGSWTEKYHGANLYWSTSGWGDGQYYYRVIACNSDAAGHEQCSGPSANGSITVTLPPPAPSASRSPCCTILSGTQYTVSWTQPSGPIGHYEIEGAWPTSTFSGATPVNVGLARSKTYTAGTVNDYGDEYSRVRACNVAGCGAWSNTVDVLIHTPTSGGGGGGGGGCDPTCPRTVQSAPLDGTGSSATPSTTTSPSTAPAKTTPPSAPLPPPTGSSGSGFARTIEPLAPSNLTAELHKSESDAAELAAADLAAATPPTFAMQRTSAIAAIGGRALGSQPSAGQPAARFTYNPQLALEAAVWRPHQAAFGGYAPTASVWYRQLHLQTVSTGTPGRFSVTYNYDPSGMVSEVTGADGTIYWQAIGTDAAGQLTGAELGNGIVTTSLYDQATGGLLARSSGFGANGHGVQNWVYSYDALGNLKTRSDVDRGLKEIATYDPLNRLIQVEQQTGSNPQTTTLTVKYDEIGNITSKVTDGINTSTYTYGTTRPHAVVSISGAINTSYTYDADGNTLTGNGKSYGWAAFNKPLEIVETPTGNKTDFWYGPDRARYEQTITEGGASTTELYIGGLMTIITPDGGATIYRHNILVAGKPVAIYTNSTDGSQQIRYLHYNGLGSVNAVTDGSGNVVARMSFTVFGERRDPTTWQVPANPADVTNDRNQTWRGYTDQEELDAVSLVHYNGRVYDPQVGRFISADPYVQLPYCSQSYNRYSYVVNNPLKYVDPTGFDANCPSAATDAAAGMAAGTVVGGLLGRMFGADVGFAIGFLGNVFGPEVGVPTTILGEYYGQKYGLQAGVALGGSLGRKIGLAIANFNCNDQPIKNKQDNTNETQPSDKNSDKNSNQRSGDGGGHGGNGPNRGGSNLADQLNGLCSGRTVCLDPNNSLGPDNGCDLATSGFCTYPYPGGPPAPPVIPGPVIPKKSD